MQNSTKGLPKKLVFFANLFLIISALIIFFLFTIAIFKFLNSNNINKDFYLNYATFFFIFFIILVYGIKKFENSFKINLSLILFVVGITLYSLEIYLQFFKFDKREKIAKKMGLKYDKRSTREVLTDLKNNGYDAYPNLNPTFFKETDGFNHQNKKIFPLGSISNSFTVLGNESGYYSVIETDEHGFNNPKGLYKNNKLDIILLGDSFTEGKAVRYDENISAYLRKKKYNVLNLGKSGNGPLIELATLKEYASILKPKVLLWLYFAENDLGDLEKELKSTTLKNYLDKRNFSQNLINRQKEIDKILINYSDNKLKIVTDNKLKSMRRTITDVLKLYHLRLMFKVRASSEPTPVLSRILQQANKKTSIWGGKMYFVYLPGRGQVHPTRDFVLKTVKDLNIPIIDLKEEIFDIHPDPLSLFPLRLHAHYNAKGYELIAEVISKKLKEDGFNTPNQ